MPTFTFSDTVSQTRICSAIVSFPTHSASSTNVPVGESSVSRHLSLHCLFSCPPFVLYPLFRGALRVSVLFSAALDPQCIMKLLILLDVGLHFAPSHPQALIEITILSSQLFPAVLKVYIFCILTAKLFSSELLCQTLS